VVVQHLARGFCDSFAAWLATTSGQRVAVAADGVALASGHVWIAPDDYHVRVDADLRVRLSGDPPVDGFRPSGTVLLESLAAFGPRAAGVILSGMGGDGARGALAMRRAGGLVLAQDAMTSAVY